MSNWDYIRFGANCTGRGLNVTGTGNPLTRVGVIESYLSSNDIPVYLEEGIWEIGQVNVGGEAQQALYTDTRVNVYSVSYEITEGTAPSYIVWVNGTSPTYIGNVQNIQDIGNTNGVRLDSGPGNIIVQSVTDSYSRVQNSIQVSDTLVEPCWYFGDSSDIDAFGSSGTDYLRALASAGTGNG
ncbi:hypothetical protein [Halostagnicola sp. A56]|uniref:hypothetical protein n=1 Tax=Halostagnicola sp. A56 TaxID=1495067 RepID=UPI0012E126C8|nr:hypothetical protein [Halostagnicola sp. A56]